jgi:hypothetical protein
MTKKEYRQQRCDELELSYNKIKHLFEPHFNASSVHLATKRFKDEFTIPYAKLFDKKSKGVGSGEHLLNFIFDDIELGGSRASCDIFRDGLPLCEIKSVDFYFNQGWVNNFSFGIDAASALLEFHENLKLYLEQSWMINPTFAVDAIDLLNNKFSEIGVKKLKFFDAITLDKNYIKFFPNDGISWVFRSNGDMTLTGKSYGNIYDYAKSPGEFYKLITNSIEHYDTYLEIIGCKTMDEIKMKFVDTILQTKIGQIPFVFFHSKTGDVINYVERLKREKLKCHCVSMSNMKMMALPY